MSLETWITSSIHTPKERCDSKDSDGSTTSTRCSPSPLASRDPSPSRIQRRWTLPSDWSPVKTPETAPKLFSSRAEPGSPQPRRLRLSASPSPPRTGRKLSPEPVRRRGTWASPSPLRTKPAELLNPQPAPWQFKAELHLALKHNDSVKVGEILAKHPELACKPLGDGTFELPLKRAIDFGCDQTIIEVLKYHGANSMTPVSADNSSQTESDLVLQSSNAKQVNSAWLSLGRKLVHWCQVC